MLPSANFFTGSQSHGGYFMETPRPRGALLRDEGVPSPTMPRITGLTTVKRAGPGGG